MSANPDQEEFKQLRRLLALKRHEQPPAGYFKDFSRQVISQLLAGQPLEKSSAAEQLGWEAPWLQRLWAAFETKPMLAGAFGVAVCALLISGVVYSERTSSGPIANLPLMPAPSAEPVVLAGVSPMGHSLPGQQPGAEVSSIGGFATPQSRLSLFQEVKDRPNPLLLTPLTYTPGN